MSANETPPIPLSPWSRPDAFPAPPEGPAFGWWAKGKAYPSEPEQLAEQCRNTSPLTPLLVWTPASPHTVTDWEVPSLYPVIQERERTTAQKEVVWGLVAVGLWSALLWMRGPEAPQIFHRSLFFWFCLGVLPLARGLFFWWRLQKGREAASPKSRDDARYRTWLARQSPPCTWILFSALAAAGLVALSVTGANEAVTRAALDKTALWSGEWWRLGTGPWLHVDVVHGWVNLVVLYVLGREIEAVFGWRWLVVILAWAMLTGSVASAAWLDTTSVGFSGAILGLLGFQLGVACVQPQRLPAGTLRSRVTSLALITAVGLVGWSIIDNAAHFGGAFAGACLGWIAARGNRFIDRPSALWTGVALIILGASAACTFWLLLASGG